MLFSGMLHYVIWWYVTLCYLVVCYIMLFSGMLHYVIWCYVTSCYLVVCYIMLFSVMLQHYTELNTRSACLLKYRLVNDTGTQLFRYRSMKNSRN